MVMLMRVLIVVGGIVVALDSCHNGEGVAAVEPQTPIVLDLEQRQVTISNFAKKNLEEANEKYTEIEKMMLDGKLLQVVLVSTDSIDALRKAYPNYFLDTQEFLSGLQKIKNELDKF